MTNPYYTKTFDVLPGTRIGSQRVEDEYLLLQTGFDNVQTALALKAPLASPTFTGVPAAPTATVGDNSTQLATTAFVTATGNLAAGIGATGTSTTSMAISVATGKAFTTQSGKSWVAGMPVTAYNSAGNYMICTVASYVGTTLTLDCATIVGTGTFAVWSLFTQPYRLTIFSASAAVARPVSALETLENSAPSTGLSASSSISTLGFGASLFVASGTVAQSNVATSPDGLTWTLRAMPSSQTWYIATDGTSKFIGLALGSTSTAKSTDGITWSAGAVLPGTYWNPYGAPVFNGIICLSLGSGTAAYTSSDNAASWGTQVLPATPQNGACVVGGLFWYLGTGTNAYTSPNGVTGNWTTRTLPAAFTAYATDFDGALIATTGTGNYYKTTDGVNWTDLGFAPVTSSLPLRTVGGVYMTLSTTFGSASTRHANNIPTVRSTTIADALSPVTHAARNTGGTVFLFPNASSNARVGRVAPTESSAATAVFSL